MSRSKTMGEMQATQRKDKHTKSNGNGRAREHGCGEQRDARDGLLHYMHSNTNLLRLRICLWHATLDNSNQLKNIIIL